jgi:hypothetical protein
MQTSSCKLVILGNSSFIVVQNGNILLRTDKLHEVESFLDYRENQQSNSRIIRCRRCRRIRS